MVRGFFFINHLDQFCEGYLLEKHVRKSFSKKSNYKSNFVKDIYLKNMLEKVFLKKVTIRAKKPLKFIHADVCNPIHLNSFCKSEDFLLFIDDFSRKTWECFQKKKNLNIEYF